PEPPGPPTATNRLSLPKDRAFLGAASLLTVVGITVFLLPAVMADKDRASDVPDLTCPIPMGPVTLALSNRQNSPKPGRSPILENIVRASLTNQSSLLSTVVIDGEPKAVESFAVTASSSTHAQMVARDFIDRAVNVRSEKPEADVLVALDTAARVSAPARNGTIVVIDSGLSTTGPVNFDQQTGVDVDTSDVVRLIRDTGHLPDLTGKTVIFIGIGEVVSPQEKLRPAQRRNLVDMWTAIAQASGASCVESVDQLGLDGPSGYLPPVQTVAIPPPPLSILKDNKFVLTLGSEATFMPDSAVLVDNDAARHELVRVANAATENPASRVSVVGTTSNSGDKANQKALSYARAQAIADILVSLGIERGRLVVEGVGSDFPEYVDDTDTNGALVPALAQRNRSVRIALISG
ncbi:OmpA family protein, partial [Saccharothrix longispora]|uniref:OmpA family protein n=1 Tax=Saccharothrix longispora TaxID=33920 RepID=UPI0028FD4051